MNSKENLVPDNLDWDSAPLVNPDKDGRYPIPIPGKTKI